MLPLTKKNNVTIRSICVNGLFIQSIEYEKLLWLIQCPFDVFLFI